MKKVLSLILAVLIGFTPEMSYAQTLSSLPAAGTMVDLTESFKPAVLRGMLVHPEKPLSFDFILDEGDSVGNGRDRSVQDESQRLVNYFLAAMTLPEHDLWVNLSPVEKDRIVPDTLIKTELGHEFLAQDYLLKQLSASLIYPETDLGKKFWSKVYAEAQEKLGTTDIPVDTFNKVWIVPQTAKVFEKGNTVYVTDIHLKVMFEADYLANEVVGGRSQVVGKENPTTLSKDVLREVIIPVIEKEVNEGKNFASLRQTMYSLALAQWYKDVFKESVLIKAYADKGKVSGIDLNAPKIKEQIYAQYLEAFKKGVFNYVKEESVGADLVSAQVIPRKYFSGGVQGRHFEFKNDAQITDSNSNKQKLVSVTLSAQFLPQALDADQANQAMKSDISSNRLAAAAFVEPMASRDVSVKLFKLLDGNEKVVGYLQMQPKKKDPQTTIVICRKDLKGNVGVIFALPTSTLESTPVVNIWNTAANNAMSAKKDNPVSFRKLQGPKTRWSILTNGKPVGFISIEHADAVFTPRVPFFPATVSRASLREFKGDWLDPKALLDLLAQSNSSLKRALAANEAMNSTADMAMTRHGSGQSIASWEAGQLRSSNPFGSGWPVLAGSSSASSVKRSEESPKYSKRQRKELAAKSLRELPQITVSTYTFDETKNKQYPDRKGAREAFPLVRTLVEVVTQMTAEERSVFLKSDEWQNAKLRIEIWAGIDQVWYDSFSTYFGDQRVLDNSKVFNSARALCNLLGIELPEPSKRTAENGRNAEDDLAMSDKSFEANSQSTSTEGASVVVLTAAGLLFLGIWGVGKINEAQIRRSVMPAVNQLQTLPEGLELTKVWTPYRVYNGETLDDLARISGYGAEELFGYNKALFKNPEEVQFGSVVLIPARELVEVHLGSIETPVSETEIQKFLYGDQPGRPFLYTKGNWWRLSEGEQIQGHARIKALMTVGERAAYEKRTKDAPKFEGVINFGQWSYQAKKHSTTVPTTVERIDNNSNQAMLATVKTDADLVRASMRAYSIFRHLFGFALSKDFEAKGKLRLVGVAPIFSREKTYLIYGNHPLVEGKAFVGTLMFVPVNVKEEIETPKSIRDIQLGTGIGFKRDALGIVSALTNAGFDVDKWDKAVDLYREISDSKGYIRFDAAMKDVQGGIDARNVGVERSGDLMPAVMDDKALEEMLMNAPGLKATITNIQNVPSIRMLLGLDSNDIPKTAFIGVGIQYVQPVTAGKDPAEESITA